ncbi:hypothetical protein FPV67DRAFT_749065 [Lyophyllum atratum]|nr:hypothetical protein FPV67DRAFT_749065 [Lyophyllum atratum]
MSRKHPQAARCRLRSNLLPTNSHLLARSSSFRGLYIQPTFHVHPLPLHPHPKSPILHPVRHRRLQQHATASLPSFHPDPPVWLARALHPLSALSRPPIIKLPPPLTPHQHPRAPSLIPLSRIPPHGVICPTQAYPPKRPRRMRLRRAQYRPEASMSWERFSAATAASLLTGTSQPLLLPSSLGPPPYNAETTTTSGPSGPSEPTTSRPTSPTPTAGLGLGLDASRAERLRQAWGSIRERLGLRPAPPPSTTPSASASETDLPTAPVSGDPREHLFGQMARAFNLGLGLAGESAAAPSTAPGTMPDAINGEGEYVEGGPGGRPSGALPAEGSFERFLLDLQTDLRVALTSTNGPPADAPAPAEPETSAVGARRGFAAPSGEDDDAEVDDDDEDEMPPPLDDMSDSDSEFEDAQEEEPETGDTDVPAYSPEAGPSHVPHEHQRGEGTEDRRTPGTTVPAAASADTRATQGSTPEVDAQGRINWWRLYRFPPIAIPPTQGIPAAAPSFTPGPIPTTATPSSAPSSPSISAMDPTLSELPFARAEAPSPQPPPSQPRTYTVVPVIVVGVQSVNTNWNLRPPTDEDMEGADDVPETPLEGDAAGMGQPRTRGGRGRGWHSRAAEAIRNLRPGRRNRNATPPNGPGSRTFLIYVIGGYYPPNHSILNGGPDTLASLEALLELADLLGHAKPPTVTKEDIEKSGLETIKSTQLEQYEREEKISSNCTERCLICLDDYQPEDDIRVMKCRHAFHQNCVDKWLETGRNNCPACRSTGVSVDGSTDT